MRRRSFTLIEMLVVVAIIGILAALLSPALQKALKRARSLNCVSRLHGISAAYFMYADDWHGFYPPCNMQAMSQYSYDMGWEKAFPSTLGVYLGYPQFYAQTLGSNPIKEAFRSSPFVCPELSKEDIPDLHRGGYGVNTRVGSFEARVSDSWKAYGFCHKASSIKSPGTQARMADRYKDLHLGTTGVNIADLNNPHKANVDLRRHLDGCNALFFDGHAKWYDGTDFVAQFDKAYRLGGNIR